MIAFVQEAARGKHGTVSRKKQPTNKLLYRERFLPHSQPFGLLQPVVGRRRRRAGGWGWGWTSARSSYLPCHKTLSTTPALYSPIYVQHKSRRRILLPKPLWLLLQMAKLRYPRNSLSNYCTLCSRNSIRPCH